MNLSTANMALVFAGCALAIGVVFVLWRRGVFGPKPTDAVEGANPTGEAK